MGEGGFELREGIRVSWSDDPAALAQGLAEDAPLDPTQRVAATLDRLQDDDEVDPESGALLVEGLPFQLGELFRGERALLEPCLRARLEPAEGRSFATRLAAACGLFQHGAADAEALLARLLEEAAPERLGDALDALRCNMQPLAAGELEAIQVGEDLGRVACRLLKADPPQRLQALRFVARARPGGVADALEPLWRAAAPAEWDPAIHAAIRAAPSLDLVEHLAAGLRPLEAVDEEAWREPFQGLADLSEVPGAIGARAVEVLAPWSQAAFARALRSPDEARVDAAAQAIGHWLWNLDRLAHHRDHPALRELCEWIVAQPPPSEEERIDDRCWLHALEVLAPAMDEEQLLELIRALRLAGPAAWFLGRREGPLERSAEEALRDVVLDAPEPWEAWSAAVALARRAGEELDPADLRLLVEPLAERESSWRRAADAREARLELEWLLQGLRPPQVLERLAAAGVLHDLPTALRRCAEVCSGEHRYAARHSVLEGLRAAGALRSFDCESSWTPFDYVELIDALRGLTRGALDFVRARQGWLYLLEGLPEPGLEVDDESGECDPREVELSQLNVEVVTRERRYRLATAIDTCEAYGGWVQVDGLLALLDRVLADAGVRGRFYELDLDRSQCADVAFLTPQQRALVRDLLGG